VRAPVRHRIGLRVMPDGSAYVMLIDMRRGQWRSFIPMPREVVVFKSSSGIQSPSESISGLLSSPAMFGTQWRSASKVGALQTQKRKSDVHSAWSPDGKYNELENYVMDVDGWTVKGLPSEPNLTHNLNGNKA
jgi:hypothetical protein